jgi:hypothetical protein
MLLVALGVGCAGDPAPVPVDRDCSGERWVGAWAAAPTDTSYPMVDRSLRLILTPLRSGEAARVRLSNRMGRRRWCSPTSTWVCRRRAPRCGPAPSAP